MLTLNEVLSGKAWRTLPFTADDQLTHQSIAHTSKTPRSQPKEQIDTEYNNTVESEIIFPVF